MDKDRDIAIRDGRNRCLSAITRQLFELVIECKTSKWRCWTFHDDARGISRGCCCKLVSLTCDACRRSPSTAGEPSLSPQDLQRGDQHDWERICTAAKIRLRWFHQILWLGVSDGGQSGSLRLTKLRGDNNEISSDRKRQNNSERGKFYKYQCAKR